MGTAALTRPEQHLRVAAELLSGSGSGSGSAGVASDAELVEQLRVAGRVARAAQRCALTAAAELTQRGVFAARGQRADTALADLLGVELTEARRVLTAAEQVCPAPVCRGQPLPAVLAGTAPRSTTDTPVCATSRRSPR